MQLKILRRWKLFAAVVTGAVFFLIVVLFLAFTLPGHGSIAKTTSATNSQTSSTLQHTAELPTRLTIPKIGVNAAIEEAGLTSQGAMAAPAGPVDVAWFDLGPRPGEVGSAVIAGHEGWKNNIAAAFDNLHELSKGDLIYVADAQGAKTTFVVRAVLTYDQNGNASAIFNSNDGKVHLNLITCEGIWNASQKSYSDRLVVFADKE